MAISIYDRTELERVRRDLRIEPNRLKRVRNALCKRFAGIDDALKEIPSELREPFRSRVRLRELEVESCHDSQLDGATKLVLRTSRGHRIEAVILRATTGRVTLCVSCQVGCAAACEFCATGKTGLVHNLSPAEILDQFVLAGEVLRGEQRRIRNLVFMGMGEPFHNEQTLITTVDRLLAGDAFHHSPGRILVSTVGIPGAMVRFARRYPRVNLALSLHAARQSVRETIVPLARKYQLGMLRDALKAINRVQEQPLMIEYLMLKNINDSRDDGAALIDYLSGLNVHVNLIPYNPIEEAPRLERTERTVRDDFAQRLRDAGLTVTIRYSMGPDIAAACGQLVQRENRRR